MEKAKGVLIAVFTAAIIFLAGRAGAASEHEGFTQHFDDSLFMITEQKLYSVEIRIKGHDLASGTNTVDIIIHDSRDKDVTGATVTVALDMPETGTGLDASPQVVEKGGGLYAVEFQIPVAGHWRMKVTVNKDGAEDSAAFDFPAVASGR